MSGILDLMGWIGREHLQVCSCELFEMERTPLQAQAGQDKRTLASIRIQAGLCMLKLSQEAKIWGGERHLIWHKEPVMPGSCRCCLQCPTAHHAHTALHLLPTLCAAKAVPPFHSVPDMRPPPCCSAPVRSCPWLWRRTGPWACSCSRVATYDRMGPRPWGPCLQGTRAPCRLVCGRNLVGLCASLRLVCGWSVVMCS